MLVEHVGRKHMSDADYFRQKAVTCRRLAAGASGKRSPGRRGNYLLELAERFEREAARLDPQFSGNKPTAEVQSPRRASTRETAD